MEGCHLTHLVLELGHQIQSAKKHQQYFTGGLISGMTTQRWLSRLNCLWGKRKPSSFPCVTVDVVAVIEVLVIERRTGWHQLLQSHLSDEEAARQVKMLQRRKSSALRHSPETQAQSETHKHTPTRTSMRWSNKQFSQFAGDLFMWGSTPTETEPNRRREKL